MRGDAAPENVETLARLLAGLLDLPARLVALEAEVRGLREEVVHLRSSAPPLLLAPAEAAARLGVSISTLRRRIRAGDVPVTRIGRSVRVDLGALRPADQAEVVRLAEAARRPR
jgi:excisionase family DNA binding protein